MKSAQWAVLSAIAAGWCGLGPLRNAECDDPEEAQWRQWCDSFAEPLDVFRVGVARLAGLSIFARLMAIASEGEP